MLLLFTDHGTHAHAVPSWNVLFNRRRWNTHPSFRPTYITNMRCHRALQHTFYYCEATAPLNTEHDPKEMKPFEMMMKPYQTRMQTYSGRYSWEIWSFWCGWNEISLFTLLMLPSSSGRWIRTHSAGTHKTKKKNDWFRCCAPWQSVVRGTESFRPRGYRSVCVYAREKGKVRGGWVQESERSWRILHTAWLSRVVVSAEKKNKCRWRHIK